eukprot:2929995-Pyramimonas_sp.AAC.1
MSRSTGRVPQVATCRASGGPLAGPGPSLSVLGASGILLGLLGGLLGVSWRHHGRFLGLSGRVLGRSWEL